MAFKFDLDSIMRKANKGIDELKRKATDIDYGELKRKSSDYLDVATDVAVGVGEAIVMDIATTVATTAGVVVSKGGEMARKAGELIDYAMDDKPKVLMEHKVIMMGGRRAGKSTILASILSQLSDNAPGKVCTIIDRTDYTQMIQDDKGNLINLPTLAIKKYEIRNYVSKRSRNTEFLVDMSPTKGKASYILEISANYTAINFEFVDVPGEWMRKNVTEHQVLVDCVKESDVFVIAIDTPYLMNTDDDEGRCVNKVYNRIEEITSTLTNIVINTSCDKKQILLCPIKCEKWVRNGEADEVVKKVCEAYRNLINRWVSHPEVTIQIMPIQTVGGFESSRLLPAKLFFKDDYDRTGVSCSEDPLTGMLMNKDGNLLRRTDGSSVENDEAFKIDYIDIPLSWYKINDVGFSPKFCEQPGFHILKFLVEKEENVIKMKAQAEQKELERHGPFWRFFKTLFHPTFGQYLPVWRNVISELEKGGYIKTAGDGFCYVRENVD